MVGLGPIWSLDLFLREIRIFLSTIGVLYLSYKLKVFDDLFRLYLVSTFQRKFKVPIGLDDVSIDVWNGVLTLSGLRMLAPPVELDPRWHFDHLVKTRQIKVQCDPWVFLFYFIVSRGKLISIISVHIDGVAFFLEGYEVEGLKPVHNFKLVGGEVKKRLRRRKPTQKELKRLNVKPTSSGGDVTTSSSGVGTSNPTAGISTKASSSTATAAATAPSVSSAGDTQERVSTSSAPSPSNATTGQPAARSWMGGLLGRATTEPTATTPESSSTSTSSGSASATATANSTGGTGGFKYSLSKMVADISGNGGVYEHMKQRASSVISATASKIDGAYRSAKDRLHESYDTQIVHFHERLRGGEPIPDDRDSFAHIQVIVVTNIEVNFRNVLPPSLRNLERKTFHIPCMHLTVPEFQALKNTMDPLNLASSLVNEHVSSISRPDAPVSDEVGSGDAAMKATRNPGSQLPIAMKVIDTKAVEPATAIPILASPVRPTTSGRDVEVRATPAPSPSAVASQPTADDNRERVIGEAGAIPTATNTGLFCKKCGVELDVAIKNAPSVPLEWIEEQHVSSGCIFHIKRGGTKISVISSEKSSNIDATGVATNSISDSSAFVSCDEHEGIATISSATTTTTNESIDGDNAAQATDVTITKEVLERPVSIRKELKKDIVSLYTAVRASIKGIESFDPDDLRSRINAIGVAFPNASGLALCIIIYRLERLLLKETLRENTGRVFNETMSDWWNGKSKAEGNEAANMHANGTSISTISSSVSTRLVPPAAAIPPINSTTPSASAGTGTPEPLSSPPRPVNNSNSANANSNSNTPSSTGTGTGASTVIKARILGAVTSRMTRLTHANTGTVPTTAVSVVTQSNTVADSSNPSDVAFVSTAIATSACVESHEPAYADNVMMSSSTTSEMPVTDLNLASYNDSVNGGINGDMDHNTSAVQDADNESMSSFEEEFQLRSSLHSEEEEEEFEHITNSDA